MDFFWIVAALTLSLGSLILAWQRWKSRESDWRGPAALLLAVLAAALWVLRFGAEIGIALALETAALLAFAFILSRIERRVDRPRRERLNDAQPVRRHIGRGVARFLIGGPLGLVAAMGVGIVVATGAPLAEQTRLILGGLIVPSLWCAAIIWTVADRRLLPQAGAFILTGCAGLGGALLLGN